MVYKSSRQCGFAWTVIDMFYVVNNALRQPSILLVDYLTS